MIVRSQFKSMESMKASSFKCKTYRQVHEVHKGTSKVANPFYGQMKVKLCLVENALIHMSGQYNIKLTMKKKALNIEGRM